MINNLLVMTEQLGWEVLLYALIGFGIVFLGIAILIVILYVFGAIMKRTGGSFHPIAALKAKRAAKKAQKTETASDTASLDEATDAVTEEEYAAIMAAVTAVLAQGEDRAKCEFVIRKIRRFN